MLLLFTLYRRYYCNFSVLYVLVTLLHTTQRVVTTRGTTALWNYASISEICWIQQFPVYKFSANLSGMLRRPVRNFIYFQKKCFFSQWQHQCLCNLHDIYKTHMSTVPFFSISFPPAFLHSPTDPPPLYFRDYLNWRPGSSPIHNFNWVRSSLPGLLSLAGCNLPGKKGTVLLPISQVTV